MNELEQIQAEVFNKFLDEGVIFQVRPATDNTPQAMYTIGRTMHGRPEMFIVGVETEGEARSILEGAIASDDAGDLIALPATWGSFRVIESQPQLLLGALAAFGKIEVLQVLWREGDQFPDEISEFGTTRQPVYPRSNPHRVISDPYGDEEE